MVKPREFVRFVVRDIQTGEVIAPVRVMLLDDAGGAVPLYDVPEGGTGVSAVESDASGRVRFWAEIGKYRLRVYRKVGGVWGALPIVEVVDYSVAWPAAVLWAQLDVIEAERSEFEADLAELEERIEALEEQIEQGTFPGVVNLAVSEQTIQLGHWYEESLKNAFVSVQATWDMGYKENDPTYGRVFWVRARIWDGNGDPNDLGNTPTVWLAFLIQSPGGYFPAAFEYPIQFICPKGWRWVIEGAGTQQTAPAVIVRF